MTSTAHWEGGALVANSKTSFQGNDVTIKDMLHAERGWENPD